MTEHRIALVTGANRGLGRSTALALARRGAKVVATFRDGSSGAAETVQMIQDAGGDAFATQLDISNVDSFAPFTTELTGEIRHRWGSVKLDVLVNNAGIGLFGRLEDVTVDSFDALVGTNFRGTFFLVQALVPHLADGSRIINVSTSLTRHVSPGTSRHPHQRGRPRPERHRLQRRRHAGRPRAAEDPRGPDRTRPGRPAGGDRRRHRRARLRRHALDHRRAHRGLRRSPPVDGSRVTDRWAWKQGSIPGIASSTRPSRAPRAGGIGPSHAGSSAEGADVMVMDIEDDRGDLLIQGLGERAKRGPRSVPAPQCTIPRPDG